MKLYTYSLYWFQSFLAMEKLTATVNCIKKNLWINNLWIFEDGEQLLCNAVHVLCKILKPPSWHNNERTNILQ